MGQAKQRGTFDQRQREAKGLLELAAARTGREVNMDSVQILDVAAFGRLNQVMMEMASRMVAAKTAMGESDFPMVADAQDDGRLVIRVSVTDKAIRVIEVPAGGWRELTQEQHTEITKALDEKQRANPEGVSNLVQTLADRMVSGGAQIRRQEAQYNAEVAGATQFVMVFDRSPASIDAALAVKGVQAELAEHFDTWLATDDHFFVFHYPRGGVKWTGTASRKDILFEDVLPAVAERAGQGLPTCIIRCNESPEFNAIRNRWRELGGLVLDLD